MDRPKLITPIILTLLSICVWWLCSYLYFSINGGLIVVFLLFVLAASFAIGAIVSWLNWIAYEINQRDMERRRAESITPMTEAANTIMRLTREQLDFLKMNGYYATQGIIGTENGPVKVMMTARGNIPWSAAERELRASTVLGLRAIRETSDGNPEREWRRLFTAYCIDIGLAIPAEGPYAAQWMDRTSRMVLAGRLGIKLYETSENGNGTEE